MGRHVLGIATQVIVMAIVISVILLFLGIGVLILIHVCIVGRTLRRGLIERNVNMVGRGSFGSTSMSQDDIEKLPCFDFTAKEEKGTTTSPPPDCAVCLENFRVGEKCRLLPSCNHSFHAECVDLWLLRTPICPICRAAADHLIIKSGSLHDQQENTSFGETGVELRDIQMNQVGNQIEIEIEIAGVQEEEDFNGDEVGLNQTGQSLNLRERERQEMGTGGI
ncbi:RING-H2 finger protein ATL3 [Sesamum alatum]|uniref:RING-H2 finger protein ATL3 n=1 Tax=Sesamum alatum TaxID=300844 RepID=A0AAE1XUB5_9LAMI|nr:RING-H2 finger protein ATL3 [Sesamum alatum]